MKRYNSGCYVEVNSNGNDGGGYNSSHMSGYGARVKQRRVELGLSQPALAKLAGVTQETISNIERGRNKGSRYAVQIAAALKCSGPWLASGKGDKAAPPEPGPDIRARVPRISWTAAGKWAEVQDPFPPRGEEEWIVTTASVGPNAFALRVVGDSMEPKIPDGATVIIDPSRTFQHGSIVLAKRMGEQAATLKQLWYDGATPLLRPLNERYPILDMPSDTQIIGVVVQMVLDFT